VALFVYAASVGVGFMWRHHPMTPLLFAYTVSRVFAAGILGDAIWRHAEWARWTGLVFSLLFGIAGGLALLILRQPAMAARMRFSALSMGIQYVATAALLLAAIALICALSMSRWRRRANDS
jgi:hypothetical protein